MDGQLGDACVLASDAESLLLDLTPDLAEIDKSLIEVEELAPVSAIAGGRVDQLEYERSARYDALAARQEIAPDDADNGGIDLKKNQVGQYQQRKEKKGSGEWKGWWLAYFSSTLDLPADWLPTYERKRMNSET